MTFDEANPLIIQRLRQAAMSGETASQMLKLLQKVAAEEGRKHWGGMAKCYFEEAFGLEIRETMALSAWAPLGGAAWTDEMIDNRYAAFLDRWKTKVSQRTGVPHTAPQPPRP